MQEPLAKLVKMKDCPSHAALAGFTRELGKVPAAMRTSLVHDQGREMARHKELSKALKLNVYFCDPHAPRQRPSNGNMNGPVRRHLPKGFDLSRWSRRDLAKIALSLNTRSRAVPGFRTSPAVFAAQCAKLAAAA